MFPHIKTHHGIALIFASFLLALTLINQSSQKLSELSLVATQAIQSIPARSQMAAALDGADSGLVGWWKFDEGSGTSARDSAGSNTGTLTNGPTWNTADYKVGTGALRFDGVNDYVTATGTSQTLNITGPFTVSAWVFRKTSFSGNIVSKLTTSSGTGDGFYINDMGGSGHLSRFIFYDGSRNQQYVSGNAIALNKWSHIVAYYDGNNIGICVNNSCATPVAVAGFSPAGTQNLTIGRYSYFGQTYWNGSLDDIRIYSRALSASEITELYNLGQVKVDVIPLSQNSSGQPNLTSGLLGWWTFDGKNMTATAANDTSGHGLTATLHDAPILPQKAPAKIGQGLAFDGVNNYASLASNPLAGAMTAANSTCAWAFIKDPNVLGAGAWDQTILNFRTDASNGVVMSNDYSSGGDFVASYRLAGIFYGLKSSTVVFKKNTWAHVCYVWNGSAITLYANGVALTGTASTNPIGTANVIGALDDTLSGIWNGTLDDIRVYSRALSATEVRQLYNQGVSKVNISPTRNSTSGTGLNAGLVGYWTFDGAKMITNIADSSGLNNNGFMSGFGATSTAVVPGKIGQGLKFDGVDDCGVVGNQASLINLTSTLSLSAWIKTSSSALQRPIVGDSYPNAGGATFGYTLEDYSGNYYRFYVENSANPTSGGLVYVQSTAGSVPLNKWTHIVGTYDGSGNLRMYINGILNNSTASSTVSTINASTRRFMIGAGDNGSCTQFYNGSIDDVRVYNRVLSAAEIRQLYNLGR